MANLNLSEFTEKLFVADADHTFIWDTAASISKRVSRNSWLNSGTLTSDAPVTISQTWNNAAVAFTGLKFNAAGTSDANSASGSLLADFQLNGGSLFKVQKNGRTTFSTSTGVIFKVNEVSGSISGDSSNSFGTVFINGDQAGGGASVVSLGGGGAEGVTCRSSGFFAFSSSGSNALHANRDTILLRDGAANTLALRNGAAAQMFRVYGTYSDGNNYRRLAIGSFNNSEFDIQTEGAGGGTGGGPLNFGTAGARRMTITTAGNLGIGTTAPGAKLDIVTSAAFDGIKITNSNTTSAAKVTVVNNTGIESSFACYASSMTDGYANNAGFGATNSVIINADGNVFSGGSNSIQFRAGGYNAAQERMRITASGNVGIGTTSPTSKLHVVGTIKPEQATMVDTALTTYTLASTDAGTIINSTSATAVTINLPTADTAAGYNVMIIQSGAGAVTIAANGNTRNSFGSAFTTAGQHAACSIVRTAASTYNLSGNLV